MADSSRRGTSASKPRPDAVVAEAEASGDASKLDRGARAGEPREHVLAVRMTAREHERALRVAVAMRKTASAAAREFFAAAADALPDIG